LTTTDTFPRGERGTVTGEVLHIHIVPEAEADPVTVDSVRAVPGRGLEGDRYYLGVGTYSETPGTGRHVTLIASEAIAEIEAQNGVQLAPGQSRRNITTRGVDLNSLVDRQLRVGEVVLLGMRLCEPCDYLEKRVGQPGTTKALVHRGGLRCDIISGGVIRVGDEITPL
jgi:MOSC domain-containing protein YiiM